MTPNLRTTLLELVQAIQGITLGSVEFAVIDMAGEALIQNWNDHNEDKIDEASALLEWKRPLNLQP
jgi:hypothetical protein